MRRTTLTNAALALAASLALAGLAGCGCSQTAATGAGSAGSAALVVQEGSGSAGSADTGADAIAALVADFGQGDMTVELTNKTGMDIVGIAVRPAGAADFAAENTFGDIDFPADATARLSFTSATSADGSDPTYDVQLTTAEGRTFLIRNVALGSLSDASVCLEGEIAYISYTDPTTGETVDDKDEQVQANVDNTGTTYDQETQTGE